MGLRVMAMRAAALVLGARALPDRPRRSRMARRRAAMLPLAVSGLILSHAPAAAQLDLSPYTSRKPSHDAVFTPDEEKIAVGEIGPEGGTLTATADDGTEYKLVVPPKAIGQKTHLYLYPIKAAANLPPGVSRVRGAILKPDGVAFAEPALLHIKTREPFGRGDVPVLGFNGYGRETRLTFARRNGREAIVPVLHFSGAAQPEDWTEATTKFFEGVGARDIGDSMIHGAEIEAQKAREAGRDPDEARRAYLQGHGAYGLLAGLLNAFASAETKPAYAQLRCQVNSSAGLAGAVALLKAGAAAKILRNDDGAPGAQAVRDAVAALPEEIESVAPETLRQIFDRCFELFEAVCLVSGNFRLMQLSFQSLALLSSLKQTVSAKRIREIYMQDTAGVAPAAVERARKLLDQAVALEDAVSPEHYRARVLQALGRCARYEVFHDADFKQTSYIGKGVYSAKTSIQAILTFRPGTTGDPIVSGKVSGEAPIRFGDCGHVFSRPSCAYFTSSSHRCEAHGPATVELTDMTASASPQKLESLSLSIDPGRVDMHYRWCNQPCPHVARTCTAAEMPLLMTFPYSADNDPMRPTLPGQGYPVLVDGQFRGHRVDPHGDDTFDDLSRVKVVHIGTGENGLTDTVRALNEIADICRTVPIVCRALLGDGKKR